MATQTHRLNILIEANDKASKALGGLGNVLTKGLAIGAAGAAAALAGLGAALVESVKLAGQQQAVEQQLTNTLKSTQNAAGLTKTELLELASSLQDLTTFGDEAIIKAEDLLLTFTNIGGPIFKEATATILDMSTALGQDLKSSTIQLGKALNDPIEGISALRRVGVSFTNDQEATIKQLVETGQTVEAQRLILAELNKEFGGSAAAAADTYQGRLQQLKNSMGDLGEAIGGVLLPGLTDLATAALPRVQEAIERAKEVLPDFGRAFQEALAGDTQLAIQDLQMGLMKVGFTPEQISDITTAIFDIRDAIVEAKMALSEFGDTDLGSLQGVITFITEQIALTTQDISKLLSDIAQITAAFEQGGFLEGLKTIGRTQFVEPARGETGGGTGQGTPHTFNPQINLTSTVMMDGQKVGEITSRRITNDLNQLARMGGRGGL